MNKTLALSLALCATTFMTSAQAGGTRDPGVNHRQHHQAARIVQGVRSGELTRRETRHLAHQQMRIRHEERRFKSDGTLTRRERAKLHHDLNHASASIYRQKHDRQHR